MRDVLCYLLTLTLLFSCISIGSAPPCLPPPREAAWWGLIFPGLCTDPEGGDSVTFDWPLLRRLMGVLRRSG